MNYFIHIFFKYLRCLHAKFPLNSYPENKKHLKFTLIM